MVIAAAAIVGAVATVGGIALSASKGKGGVTTTSELEFPEETRRLIGDIEFPMMKSALGEQSALLGGLLGGSQASPFANTQFGQRPLQAARAGLTRGAKDAGISDLSGLDSLDALSPQLVQAIRTLALQNAAQRTTVVPAGYGPFLSPSTLQTSSTDSSPFETGFAIAGAAANAGGSIARSYNTG